MIWLARVWCTVAAVVLPAAVLLQYYGEDAVLLTPVVAPLAYMGIRKLAVMCDGWPAPRNEPN